MYLTHMHWVSIDFEVGCVCLFIECLIYWLIDSFRPWTLTSLKQWSGHHQNVPLGEALFLIISVHKNIKWLFEWLPYFRKHSWCLCSARSTCFVMNGTECPFCLSALLIFILAEVKLLSRFAILAARIIWPQMLLAATFRDMLLSLCT